MANEPSDPNRESYPARDEPHFARDYGVPDDEISLFDLWAVLERRWYVILGVGLLVILLGVAYGLLRETAFTYRTAVEIGTLKTEDGEDQLIESSASVRNRLTNAIIPRVQARLAEEIENVPDVAVDSGAEDQASNVLVLESTAPTRRGEVINDFHARIIKELTAVHDRLTQARRSELERQQASLQAELELIQDERVLAAERGQRRRAIEAAQDTIESLKAEREETVLGLDAEIAAAKRRLDSLAAQRERTKAELQRLDEREKVLQERLATAETILADLRQTRSGLMNTETNDSVLGLFLGSAEIESAQKRVDEISDELRFGLPERRDELQAQLDELADERAGVKDTLKQKRSQRADVEADYQRQIQGQRRTIDKQQAALDLMAAEHENEVAEQKREIGAVAARIDQLAPTRASFVSLKSLKPSGAGAALILALSLVLGAMLGVFSAFFWEFLSNARRYSKHRSA